MLRPKRMLVDESFGTLTATQADLVRRIDRSAKELFDLVSSTLDLGRLEAGRNPVERAPLDLAGMVAALAPDVEPLVQPGVALLWDSILVMAGLGVALFALGLYRFRRQLA